MVFWKAFTHVSAESSVGPDFRRARHTRGKERKGRSRGNRGASEEQQTRGQSRVGLASPWCSRHHPDNPPSVIYELYYIEYIHIYIYIYYVYLYICHVVFIILRVFYKIYIYRFYSRNIYDKYRLIVMVLYIYYSIYDVYMGLCLDRYRYLCRPIDL